MEIETLNKPWWRSAAQGPGPILVLALGAGLLAAVGAAPLAIVATPVVAACVLGLLGDTGVFLWLLVAISGIGFYWAADSFQVLGRTVNVSGLHWGLALGTGLVILLRGGSWALPKAFRPYALFAALAAVGIAWAPDRFEGVRHALLFTMPLVIGWATWRFAHTPHRVRALRSAFWVALIASMVGLAVVQAVGLFGADPAGIAGAMGNRTFGIFLLPLYALAVAGARGGSRRFVVVAALLVLLGVATLSRMVLLTMLVLPLVAMAGTPFRRKLGMAAVALAVAVVLVQFGPLRARLLATGASSLQLSGISVTGTGGEAELALGGLNLTGRGWIWFQLWEHARAAPWIGHGTGSATHYMASVMQSPLRHPHNDYLRMFHDLGIVGLVVFVAFLALLLRLLFGRYRSATTAQGRELTLAAMLALIGYGILALTDNVAVYTTFFTQNVFILTALGLRASGQLQT